MSDKKTIITNKTDPQNSEKSANVLFKLFSYGLQLFRNILTITECTLSQVLQFFKI